MLFEIFVTSVILSSFIFCCIYIRDHFQQHPISQSEYKMNIALEREPFETFINDREINLKQNETKSTNNDEIKHRLTKKAKNSRIIDEKFSSTSTQPNEVSKKLKIAEMFQQSSDTPQKSGKSRKMPQQKQDLSKNDLQIFESSSVPKKISKSLKDETKYEPKKFNFESSFDNSESTHKEQKKTSKETKETSASFVKTNKPPKPEFSEFSKVSELIPQQIFNFENKKLDKKHEAMKRSFFEQTIPSVAGAIVKKLEDKIKFELATEEKKRELLAKKRQAEEEKQRKLDEERREKERKLQEEAEKQRKVQEEAEKQRKLLEDAEKQRKLQEEAEKQRKSQEQEAEKQRKLQEVAEKQRKSQEDAEKQKQQQEAEKQKQTLAATAIAPAPSNPFAFSGFGSAPTSQQPSSSNFQFAWGSATSSADSTANQITKLLESGGVSERWIKEHKEIMEYREAKAYLSNLYNTKQQQKDIHKKMVSAQNVKIELSAIAVRFGNILAQTKHIDEAIVLMNLMVEDGYKVVELQARGHDRNPNSCATGFGYAFLFSSLLCLFPQELSKEIIYALHTKNFLSIPSILDENQSKQLMKLKYPMASDDEISKRLHTNEDPNVYFDIFGASGLFYGCMFSTDTDSVLQSFSKAVQLPKFQQGYDAVRTKFATVLNQYNSTKTKPHNNFFSLEKAADFLESFVNDSKNPSLHKGAASFLFGFLKGCLPQLIQKFKPRMAKIGEDIQSKFLKNIYSDSPIAVIKKLENFADSMKKGKIMEIAGADFEKLIQKNNAGATSLTDD